MRTDERVLERWNREVENDLLRKSSNLREKKIIIDRLNDVISDCRCFSDFINMRYFLVVDKRGNVDEYVALINDKTGNVYKDKITCITGDSEITMICESIRDLFDMFSGRYY